MTTLQYFALGMFSIIIQSCQSVPHPLVIAHRGGADLAPENTLAAFDKAIELGADMIEIDVEQTLDSVLVVIHDRSVDRTTNGMGLVDSLPYAQIRRLDAGSWFDSEYAGEHIPTLQEVIEHIDGRAQLLIEIKEGSERYPGIERRTVDCIHRNDVADWVVVQSFNLEAVRRIVAIDPLIRTYYLLGRNFEGFYDRYFEDSTVSEPQAFSFGGVAVHHSQIDASHISAIKASGLGIYTWTVDDREEMQRLVVAGIDGIITDRPDILLELLGN